MGKQWIMSGKQEESENYALRPYASRRAGFIEYRMESMKETYDAV